MVPSESVEPEPSKLTVSCTGVAVKAAVGGLLAADTVTGWVTATEAAPLLSVTTKVTVKVPAVT